jgi:ribosome maturation factor RimP
MADTFEEVAKFKGTRTVITFSPEDGKPVSGEIVEADKATHTVTLADKRVVTFPPNDPAKGQVKS